jgi:hypothetical protein
MTTPVGGASLTNPTFREFLETLRDHQSYFVRAFVQEALAHHRLPEPVTFEQLEAHVTAGRYISRVETARRVWRIWRARTTRQCIDARAEGGAR